MRDMMATSSGGAAADGGKSDGARTWEELCAGLEHEHAVPGGLSEDERLQLFEEHVAALLATAAAARPPLPRVDDSMSLISA